MDSTSTISAGLVAYASKDLIAKLLGPSADYMGGEIKGLVEKYNINLNSIFVKAFRKSGESLEQDGQVNPRVLKGIIDDGSFCDEDLLKEYYAGILSSSRTTDMSDDIGVSHLATLKSLSVYQVRLHYLFYTEFHRHYSINPCSLGGQIDRENRRIYMPYKVFADAIRLENVRDFETILTHSITGLVKNNLLGNMWQCGSKDVLVRYFPSVQQDGIILEPSLPGIEFYIWSNGKSKLSPSMFLFQKSGDDEVQFPIIDGSLPTLVNA
jgi:hypothetical protein